ncbi:MAG: SCO family protein [Actinobacteria bacterium]|nr:SCO family protein [Actinomycetota bacterium]
MPGMKSGLSDTNPIIVAAFKTALWHQGLIIAAVLALLAFAWVGARQLQPRQQVPGWSAHLECTPRRVLRIGFGVLWLFDGLLQAQPAMAAGLPSQVMQAGAAGSPAWVQHMVNWAATAWSFHPVEAGAAAVWIQLGIGAWLIAAPAGWTSRLAGLVSLGWGLLVWVFGEAFGGIFAPGLTFLFGAPGAVLYYCAAGALIALPEHSWRSGRLGRQILAVLGLFLAAMAILQAWPGRGFWQGTAGGRPGPLAAMVSAMADTPQPHVLAALVRWFGSLTASHGFAVNLVAVLVLAVIAAALLAGPALLASTAVRDNRPAEIRSRLIRPALILLLVFCLADWLLIEDLGFFGGLGTDPNSMIPMSLLAAVGYLALTGDHAPEQATDEEPAAATQPRSLLAAIAPVISSAGPRTILTVWAASMIITGAAPMALAQTSPTASPVIAQAIAGSAAPLNFTAPAFSLTDQNGRAVSLASLRGKVVLLTFLDPVCTTDCPLMAQELKAADQLLGDRARDAELVAIVANPVYRSVAYTRAFSRQEQLSGLPNWLFLTGSLDRLQRAWRDYNITVQTVEAGGMVAHNDVAYVIDRNGHTRSELNFDPGPGTASTESSFAAELAAAAQRVMGPS